MTDKDATICGHGSGTPSLKNLWEYSGTRYGSFASNGKRKGLVSVRRFKKLNEEGRKAFHDSYKTLLGRNVYSQSLREYVYTPYHGTYYSDCSSSGCMTLKHIGYSCPNYNTAGIYRSDLFENVPVVIVEGHIRNPDILNVGDALLFVGNDPSRPLQIGHVEYVYELKKDEVKNYMFEPKTVFLGDKNNSVLLLCEILKARDIYKGGITNVATGELIAAVNNYQGLRRAQGVELGTNGQNDSVCGPMMWRDLIAI